MLPDGRDRDLTVAVIQRIARDDRSRPRATQAADGPLSIVSTIWPKEIQDQDADEVERK